MVNNPSTYICIGVVILILLILFWYWSIMTIGKIADRRTAKLFSRYVCPHGYVNSDDCPDCCH